MIVELTAQRLRQVLRYDAGTGVFTWRIATGPRARGGAAAGTIDRKGYRRIRIDGRKHAAHRLAWLYMAGAWPELQIDHRNRNRDDNRWKNLRQASNGQNQANAISTRAKRGGLKGAYPCRNRWQAIIGCDGKHHYLGSFPSEAAAHAAYADAAKKYFGDYARVA